MDRRTCSHIGRTPWISRKTGAAYQDRSRVMSSGTACRHRRLQRRRGCTIHPNSGPGNFYVWSGALLVVVKDMHYLYGEHAVFFFFNCFWAFIKQSKYPRQCFNCCLAYIWVSFLQHINLFSDRHMAAERQLHTLAHNSWPLWARGL